MILKPCPIRIDFISGISVQFKRWIFSIVTIGRVGTFTHLQALIMRETEYSASVSTITKHRNRHTMVLTGLDALRNQLSYKIKSDIARKKFKSPVLSVILRTFCWILIVFSTFDKWNYCRVKTIATDYRGVGPRDKSERNQKKKKRFHGQGKKFKKKKTKH